MQDRHARPVKQSGTFGPFAHREALPLVLLEQERWHVANVHLSTSSGRLHDPDCFVAGDSQHIGIPMRVQPGTQVQIPSIDRIRYHPRDGELSLPHALEHASGQFRLGLEAN